MGWRWLDAVHPEDRDPAREVILRANARKESVAVDYRLRRSDGTYRWAVDAARPRFGPGGEYLGLTGSIIDIHDRKRVEEQLRQAAKMEAIGRLAGGLAHDFNNQLQAVAGFARFVEADQGLSQDARVDLHEIKKSADRMASLTRQLLAFSRQQVLMPETLELAAAVADAQPLLQRLIGPTVEFVTESAPEPVWVRVDRTQLVQILMNLAINARDAMPFGGRLHLDVAPVHMPKTESEERDAVPAGEYGRLTVRDTGTGISPEHLPHIFEPFFTTKGVGQGTGLGLATVHGIVAQSQGHVEVESSTEGTEFTLLFPLADPPIAELASEGEDISGNDSSAEQSLRVLVVDDEAGVRQFLARVLTEAGHNVLTASGAREALALVEQARGEVDLVLSDLVMPGMSGAELGDFLAAKYPDVSLGVDVRVPDGRGDSAGETTFAGFPSEAGGAHPSARARPHCGEATRRAPTRRMRTACRGTPPSCRPHPGRHGDCRNPDGEPNNGWIRSRSECPTAPPAWRALPGDRAARGRRPTRRFRSRP